MEKIFLKTDLGKSLENYDFPGLKRTLNMTPQQVISKIKESGLRGRGGAGFPTGIKWETVYNIQDEEKFVICNADEGEPGTFKDRFLMENLSFKVLEGIIISAYATGSKYGYIYIRGEYVKSIKIMRNAIEKLYEKNILGKNILNSDFSFDLKLVRGAGAYVCGDETSLINSIEGERGKSRIKPPLPVFEGLFGKPTVVNNVETLAAAAEIMKYEDNIYSEMGTERSRGTKLISISGDVNKPGVYEVEFGELSVKEIINELAGGVKGSGLGFVIPGGISTEVLTEEEIDVPYTYENLQKIGSNVGSGGMIVVSKDRNYLEIAKNVSDFFRDETCGTCFPCREGNKNINKIVTDIYRRGYPTSKEIEIISDIKGAVSSAARCGFGESSLNLILSLFDKFYNKKVTV
ncbi:NADH-quinone oxidoreductase subunit F [Petrotoga sp. 9PWA.NaAc.5.4]|uniref:complex I 51 kDa subunit family protein n=1 Tax=Petrotoga sp. 9PWA.NaAc.5.4 TaxID=1434328 RepID=UPI000CB04DAC|nr:NADH-ubiquinone oxidoreductase-F iron-sulfur binding region domain-containing protein [Petrotoga sp. 9PWA.NaAc.5.4]PNR96725.1 NADH dehydrogenase [Petrotoga sp. 9PWA.NaAc.5.4]